jgi:hypothetical protein
VSIVLPLHQQSNQITEIAEEYEMALRRLPASYELLLIVNGSSDGTMAACEALTRRSEHVRAHELAEAGWGGGALRAGTGARRDPLLYEFRADHGRRPVPARAACCRQPECRRQGQSKNPRQLCHQSPSIIGTGTQTRVIGGPV